MGQWLSMGGVYLFIQYIKMCLYIKFISDTHYYISKIKLFPALVTNLSRGIYNTVWVKFETSLIFAIRFFCSVSHFTFHIRVDRKNIVSKYSIFHFSLKFRTLWIFWIHNIYSASEGLLSNCAAYWSRQVVIFFLSRDRT